MSKINTVFYLTNIIPFNRGITVSGTDMMVSVSNTVLFLPYRILYARESIQLDMDTTIFYTNSILFGKNTIVFGMDVDSFPHTIDEYREKLAEYPGTVFIK